MISSSDEDIPHNHLIDKVALVNAILGAAALYPQLYILIMFGNGQGGLSTVSFGLIFANSIIWLWYGLHRKTLALIISSFFNAFAAGGILLLIAIH
jgi:hypothetical protein